MAPKKLHYIIMAWGWCMILWRSLLYAPRQKLKNSRCDFWDFLSSKQNSVNKFFLRQPNTANLAISASSMSVIRLELRKKSYSAPKLFLIFPYLKECCSHKFYIRMPRPRLSEIKLGLFPLSCSQKKCNFNLKNH